MPTVPSRIQASQYGPVNPAGRMRPISRPIILQKGAVQGLEQTPNRQTLRLQQAVQQSTAGLRGLPWAAGNLIEGISLTTGAANVVNHGLPQAWRGCLLMTFQNSFSLGWYVQHRTGSAAAQDKNTIQIFVNVDVLCDCWVW